MSSYGVTTDYEYGATHKRQRIEVWSGPFYSTWEATGLSLPRGDGYVLTTYNGDRVTVRCGLRTTETFEQVDEAVASALGEHYARRGAVTLQDGVTR